MTDDQGFGDVRSHGNPHVDTPVHDQIAAEGVRLDRFFVSPVCAPTRASLLTGRWHLRTGVHGVTRGQETMRADEITMAEILKSAGYVTGAFGKWHNGAHFPHHPNGQGFDQFVGFCAGHWNNYFDGHFERNGVSETFEGFLIDRLTDEAVRFIETNATRPWFCYVPYNTPHTPWQVPERYWRKYSDRNIGNEAATCAYAMVENIDDNMGRLLATLKKTNLERKTIVIFLTDNGANSNRFNAGMKGRKGSLHEGGTRVPCFIRCPGTIPSERTITQITAHVDLLPTIAELVGVHLPAEVQIDGTSLVPLLQGKTSAWPSRNLFAHWGNDKNGTPSPARGAIRTDRWRAVQYNDQWELYDMLADPSQLNDLAGENRSILQELASRYDQWFAEVTSSGFESIPTEIGHRNIRQVSLPGHEAVLHSPNAPGQRTGISYVGRSGWANDWITNWNDADAYPAWPVRVVDGGRFRIELECSAPPSSVGSVLRIELGEASIEQSIVTPLLAKPVSSPDRIPRKEVFEKIWPRLEVGEVALETGDFNLRIRAKSMKGPRFLDVKAVHVTRVNSE